MKPSNIPLRDLLPSEAKLCEALLFRALCDALGFTGLPAFVKLKNKTVIANEEHREAVLDAVEFFYQDEDYILEQYVCPILDLDYGRTKAFAIRLIEARNTGDHSQVPELWRRAFRTGRMPSFTAYRSDIEDLLRRLNNPD